MSERSQGRQFLPIGAVAERTGLSLRTLRHYDEIGLVVPSQRTSGGHRLYAEDDVQRILLIRRMKPLEFTLEQMRELLDITHEVSRPGASIEAREKLHGIEAIAIERRSALETKVAMADEFLARLRNLTTLHHAEGDGPAESTSEDM